MNLTTRLPYQDLHVLRGTLLAGLLSLNCATTQPDVDRKSAYRVELGVSDDGRGFDASTVQPGHHGLSIIRERASARGADLTIESQPDQGTEIGVMWEERQ
jgi:nitrate/nitrite-specific signal transduction histidine kinase